MNSLMSKILYFSRQSVTVSLLRAVPAVPPIRSKFCPTCREPKRFLPINKVMKMSSCDENLISDVANLVGVGVDEATSVVVVTTTNVGVEEPRDSAAATQDDAKKSKRRQRKKKKKDKKLNEDLGPIFS